MGKIETCNSNFCEHPRPKLNHILWLGDLEASLIDFTAIRYHLWCYRYLPIGMVYIPNKGSLNVCGESAKLAILKYIFSKYDIGRDSVQILVVEI